MAKRALITGITGQDGSYLAELLLAKGYEVHGIVRRVALEDPDNRLRRLHSVLDKVHLHAASLESCASLYDVVQATRPDECYHLAAQSFVSYSFEDEFSTLNTNINGTHSLLSAFKSVAPKCRFYFAGSSEMFGNADVSPQNERSSLNPRSAYGISKVAGHHLTKYYREAYDMFACSGMLFNHESPRRGHEFVTRKISRGVANIKAGRQDKISLGNLAASRDWGFAGDYVDAMWRMLQGETPDDYVVATGKAHTVEDFVTLAFEIAGLPWQEHVEVDQRYFRPAEVYRLKGDYTKAREQLGWQPQVPFEELVCRMVEADLADVGAR